MLLLVLFYIKIKQVPFIILKFFDLVLIKHHLFCALFICTTEIVSRDFQEESLETWLNLCFIFLR
jgi:hypothetical protein